MENWTKNQFKAFLLVYAANADFVMKESEINFIIENVGEENYQEALDLFGSLTDMECVEALTIGREKYYSSEGDREQLFGEVKTIFEIDNDFALLEDNVIRALQRLM